MADPLPLVESTQLVAPGIWRWSAYSPHHRVELGSHLVWDGIRAVVFDPLPLNGRLWNEWPNAKVPGVLVVTNFNHERALDIWRTRFPNAAIVGWPTSPTEAEIDSCLVGWKAIPLPGGAPGETAYQCAHLDLMVFGDAVVNLAIRGLELLPDKYCENSGQLQESLRRIPRYGRALLAHGEPLLEAAAERVGAVLG